MTQAGLEIVAADAELPLALELPDGLSVEELKTIGRRLFAREKSLQWQIGDWWNYFVAAHGEETARRATTEIWGVKDGTARTYGWVAEKFDPVIRITTVPFGHYQVAGALPDDQRSSLIKRAAAAPMTQADIRHAVHVLKASNDPDIGTVEAVDPVERKPRPEWLDAELVKTHGEVVELAEALQALRELTRREADIYAFSLGRTREADECRKMPTPPGDFEIVFVKFGRIACESHYGVSRITVNRWLLNAGKQRLIDERSNFVKYQRNIEHGEKEVRARPVDPMTDSYLPVARMAAAYIQISRYGGWPVSQCDTGGWIVGTTWKSSEELIAMAERQGFDRQAAVTEAREEGY